MRGWLKTGVLVVLAASSLAAHDTWLVPVPIESGFRVTPGQSVKVALNTSEDFPTSEAAAAPDRIARFEYNSLERGWNVVTKLEFRVEGKSLVADVTPGPGLTFVAAVTHPRLIVLEAPVFTEYITEEGLEEIVTARAARGESEKPGRERYSKVAKLALCAPGEGVSFGNSLDLPEIQPLEIVPEEDPCELRVGDTLHVQVLFQDEPLGNVRVGAGYAGVHGHHYPVWVTTDAEGRAAIPLDRSGAWFVRTLHMIPSAEFEDADWQSWFSTLTFEVR